MFSTAEIKDILNLNSSIEELDISNIHFDSRKIQTNGLFIALSNGTNDGHLYIEDAIKNGAVMILIEDASFLSLRTNFQHIFLVSSTKKALQELARSYRQKITATVIAVTGSNGKTTTKDSIAHVLSSQFSVHKTQGNYNNHLGLPLTILQTPLHCEVLVLEMGMNHAGEIDLLASISKPDIAVISNIGESHIEHLGSKENIAHAKGEVLSYLHPNSFTLLPGDSDFSDLLASKTNANTVFFGLNETNSFYPKEVKQLSSGMEFTIKNTTYQIPLFGVHNVSNVLTAIYLAQHFQLNTKTIQDSLATISVSGMRFEHVQGKNNASIVNDAYNASPTSMKASISTFLSINDKRRKILVLGDMFELGEFSKESHYEVGEYIEKRSSDIEFLITVGHNSRLYSHPFSGRKRHFDTKKEAEDFIKVFLSSDFSLFFKASRGMKFDEFIHTLKA